MIDQACDECGAEPAEECRPDCTALISILNGIEDATNLRQREEDA